MAVDASTVARPPRFRDQVASRLDEPTRARLKTLRWVNRLTSAWAPVTVLGISFLIYLFVVELHTPNAVWAQPAQKAFALLMVVWTVGNVIARTLVKPFARLRRARHQGWELLDEVGRLVDKHRDALRPRDVDDLVDRSAALSTALTGNDADAVEKGVGDTSAAADKHLVRWRKQSTFDFAMGFVKALAVALVIRSILLEPFRIPSGSMIPTLEIGDQIFVNKFIYGVRLPFTNYVPFQIVRAPRRGDVIVFENPLQGSKDFIKRVIGVGGDTVEVVEEVVFINGVEQPRELVDPDFESWEPDERNWKMTRLQLWNEDLGGYVHITAQDPSKSPLLREGPFRVPEGHVFVMGDNRDNSADSRSGFGFADVGYVPLGHIKGKAMVVWMAWGHDGLGARLFGGSGLRTDRLFEPVR